MTYTWVSDGGQEDLWPVLVPADRRLRYPRKTSFLHDFHSQAAYGRRAFAMQCLMTQPEGATLDVPALDVNYINPFIEQTVFVFNTMLDWDIKRRSLEIKESFAPRYDISGVVPLSGKAKGAVVLSFSRDLACRMLSGIMGTDVLQVNEEVVDLVGELTNTISGRASASLARYEIRLGVPTVVIGRTSTISFPEQATPILVEFRTPWSPIALEVGLL